MKRRTISLAMVAILVVSLFAFVGCEGKIECNAELYYNAQAWMKAEYLESNMTLGAHVGIEEDTNLPQTRTDIIKEKSVFNSAFNWFPNEVDFSKKMIIIHFFTSSYPDGPYKLKKVIVDGDTLSIEFKLNKAGSSSVPDATKPQQTAIVVLMDKVDVITTDFNIYI